jgi:hypothetical protein
MRPRHTRRGNPTTCIDDPTRRCPGRRVAGCGARPARCLTPAHDGRDRRTPRHRRHQRRGPRHDRAEGVIPSPQAWRLRPRRQRGQMPRAIPAPVSGGAGPVASRGQGRRRGPRGHGSRSSSTPGPHLLRPRAATAASEPRRQRHRGRCAPTQAAAPLGPCEDPRVRPRRQPTGPASLTEVVEPGSSVLGGPRWRHVAGRWSAPWSSTREACSQLSANGQQSLSSRLYPCRCWGRGCRVSRRIPPAALPLTVVRTRQSPEPQDNVQRGEPPTPQSRHAPWQSSRRRLMRCSPRP